MKSSKQEREVLLEAAQTDSGIKTSISKLQRHDVGQKHDTLKQKGKWHFNDKQVSDVWQCENVSYSTPAVFK